jgi:hypothetical protein
VQRKKSMRLSEKQLVLAEFLTTLSLFNRSILPDRSGEAWAFGPASWVLYSSRVYLAGCVSASHGLFPAKWGDSGGNVR